MADTIKKEIVTRISLRNDTLQNWDNSKSTNPLLKGEIALARLSGDLSDSYQMRIGVGNKTWIELSSSNIVIPQNNVIGLTKKIQSLSTTYRETTNIDELSDFGSYANGDIAVEKKDIADGKQSYCAYRYNSQIRDWQALDGNYDASNVYFSQNFSLAGDYTQVGNVKLSQGTLQAAGKSVKSLFEDIFDKTIQPTHKSDPSASVKLTNSGAKEIGSKITPEYTTTFTQGTYNQSWDNTNVNDGTSAKSWTISDGTTQKTASSGSFAEFTVTSSTNYKLNGSMEYNAGNIAKDNKGNDSNPVVQHLSGTIPLADSSAITGYYPYYYLISPTKKFADPDSLTSADIISDTTASSGIVTKNGFQKGVSKPSSESSFTQRTMQQWFWLVKSGTINGISVKQQSPEAPHTVKKYANAIQLPLANGQGSINYDVWYVSNDGAMTNGFKVTIS